MLSAHRGKLIVRVKGPSETVVRLQTLSSQAVSMPPDAPEEFYVVQCERRAGRNERRFKVVKMESFVSWRAAEVGRVRGGAMWWRRDPG